MQKIVKNIDEALEKKKNLLVHVLSVANAFTTMFIHWLNFTTSFFPVVTNDYDFLYTITLSAQNFTKNIDILVILTGL